MRPPGFACPACLLLHRAACLRVARCVIDRYDTPEQRRRCARRRGLVQVSTTEAASTTGRAERVTCASRNRHWPSLAGSRSGARAAVLLSRALGVALLAGPGRPRRECLGSRGEARSCGLVVVVVVVVVVVAAVF